MKIARRLSARRGVVMVEIAIGLPLFLLFIYVLIFFSIYFNARLNLTSAMGNAVRLALTRANFGPPMAAESEETGALPEIDSFANGTAAADSVTKYFAMPETTPTTDWDPFYATDLNKVFALDAGLSVSVTTLRDMPREYMYALAYLYEGMLKSTGNGMRFPCDPLATGSKNGPGCLHCYFRHPRTLESPTDAVANGTPRFGPPPRNFLSMECKYLPGNALIRPIYALVRLLTGVDSPTTRMLTITDRISTPST